jgi:hypothetical protein
MSGKNFIRYPVFYIGFLVIAIFEKLKIFKQMFAVIMFKIESTAKFSAH